MWSIAENIAFRVIEGEAFVLDVERRRVHRINEVGAFVLQGVEQGKGEEDILKEIVKKYEVDEDTVRQDISSFLRKLLEKRIIRGEDG